MTLWLMMLHKVINTPSLVTKCSVVQKISSGQTFYYILNLCYDTEFDLEHSNQIFSQNTLAYDAVPEMHLKV